MGLRSLNLLSRCREAPSRIWHTAWALDQHCLICHALGRLDELAAHADELAEISEKGPELRRTEAAARIWQAVSRRTKGDEHAASQLFHRGMGLLAGLERRDSACADGVAAYYEASGDLTAAVGVRDREIAELTRKGMFHRACESLVERCRLLAQAGKLTPADLDAVHVAAGKMRFPEWYLKRLPLDPFRHQD